MENINESINSKLSQIEKENEIKIILAVESGSRAWGMNSANSDHDIRFIYVHNRDWYVSLFDKSDNIQIKPDNIYDIHGWDIKKFLLLMMKSNTSSFEWLSSPISYIRDNVIIDELISISKNYFKPSTVCWNYYGLANSTLDTLRKIPYNPIKDYLYILRAFSNINYIDKYSVMPPMSFKTCLFSIDIPDDIRKIILYLINSRLTQSDVKTITSKRKLDILDKYIEEQMTIWDDKLDNMTYKKTSNDYKNELDNLFRKIINLSWEAKTNND